MGRHAKNNLYEHKIPGSAPCISLRGFSILSEMTYMSDKSSSPERKRRVGINAVEILLAIAEGANEVPKLSQTIQVSTTNIYQYLTRLEELNLIKYGPNQEYILTSKALGLIEYTDPE